MKTKKEKKTNEGRKKTSARLVLELGVLAVLGEVRDVLGALLRAAHARLGSIVVAARDRCDSIVVKRGDPDAP